MTDRPIIFNGEMVRAILDGRKTQTRRVVKPQPNPPNHRIGPNLDLDDDGGCGFFDEDGRVWHCPYGQPGDRLWVRETHRFTGGCEDHPLQTVKYRADDPTKRDVPSPDYPFTWRPSIHMPRWASRLTLEVTGVRVERVRDISADDAQREGIELGAWGCWTHAFAELWDAINAKRGYSWESNPFVWVIEFRRLSDEGPA